MRRSDSQTVTIISNSYQIIANYRENLQDCLGKLAQHRDHWLFISRVENIRIYDYVKFCIINTYYTEITFLLHQYINYITTESVNIASFSLAKSQQNTEDIVKLSKMCFNTNFLSEHVLRYSCYNTARKSSRLAFVPGIAFSPNHYWQEERRTGIFFTRQISKSAYKCGPARWWQDPAGHAGLPSVPGDCQHCKQITLSFSCRTLTPYQLEQSKYLQHGRTINCHTENYYTPIKNIVLQFWD